MYWIFSSIWHFSFRDCLWKWSFINTVPVHFILTLSLHVSLPSLPYLIVLHLQVWVWVHATRVYAAYKLNSHLLLHSHTIIVFTPGLYFLILRWSSIFFRLALACAALVTNKSFTCKQNTLWQLFPNLTCCFSISIYIPQPIFSLLRKKAIVSLSIGLFIRQNACNAKALYTNNFLKFTEVAML